MSLLNVCMCVHYIFPLIIAKHLNKLRYYTFSCSTTWPSSPDLLGENTQVFWLTDSVAAMLWARSVLLRAFEIRANAWVTCFSQAVLPWTLACYLVTIVIYPLIPKNYYNSWKSMLIFWAWSQFVDQFSKAKMKMYITGYQGESCKKIASFQIIIKCSRARDFVLFLVVANLWLLSLVLGIRPLLNMSYVGPHFVYCLVSWVSKIGFFCLFVYGIC